MQGPDAARLRVGEVCVEARRGAAGWTLDGVRAPNVVVTGTLVTVFSGAGHGFDIVDALAVAAHVGAVGNVVVAPMPGLVKAVFVTSGQAVALGDRLAVLEAMKMEHTLVAPRDGVVAEVLAEAGAQVEAGAALIALVEDA
jgi:3-methylcrotonyl-CoA carboxylase alpha subunit